MIAALVCSAAIAACGDASTSPDRAQNGGRNTPGPTGAPFVVSDPSVGTAGASQSGSGAAQVVYISLPPGSVPAGVQGTIRNRTTGSVATVAIVAGGFDPLPVAASAGDTLVIDVEVSSGDPPPPRLAVVPRARAPIVVRTNPPPRKRQVPLNTTILVVFSEPVDPATLTTTTVLLRQGAALVNGRIESTDPARLTATFTPSAPLTPETDYELVITTGVRDLDGERLEVEVVIPFTTVVGGVLAFVSDRDGIAHIYTANVDGSDVRQLTTGPEPDGRPAWSPDGRRIAFARGPVPGTRGIFVMNADGSGLTQLTNQEGDRDPAWSPDGSRILFARLGPAPVAIPVPRYIVTMNPDGSGVAVLHDGGRLAVGPAWSPDGARIAFESIAGELGVVPQQVYLMRADGSGARRLTAPFDGFEFAEGRPAWSPDGSLIAFFSFGFGLAVMNSDVTGVPRSLTGDGFGGGSLGTPSTTYFADPSWSPGGRVLAFAKGRNFSGNGPLGIHLVSIDGSLGTGVLLTLGSSVGQSGDFAPAWSPVRR